MQDIADILRERDVSWATIGAEAELAVSRQAAWAVRFVRISFSKQVAQHEPTGPARSAGLMTGCATCGLRLDGAAFRISAFFRNMLVVIAVGEHDAGFFQRVLDGGEGACL